MHAALIGIAGNDELWRRVRASVEPQVARLIGQRHFEGTVLMTRGKCLSIANSKSCRNRVPLKLDVCDGLALDVLIAAKGHDIIIEREDCLPATRPLRSGIVPDLVIQACKCASKTPRVVVPPDEERAIGVDLLR